MAKGDRGDRGYTGGNYEEANCYVVTNEIKFKGRDGSTGIYGLKGGRGYSGRKGERGNLGLM